MVSITTAVFVAVLLGAAEGCNRLGAILAHAEQNETSHNGAGHDAFTPVASPLMCLTIHFLLGSSAASLI
ncbi:hypothetical protein L798_12130 [Zootermopsis nevadensis]|uniref:Uncharacterized protein n=1 Tax=Zootermopsis nevadensis TaxID=136037 RepID=A0A067QWR0_ZOONE|nr:hypothetical protein L798_12130 [Zootermopsis nevadensis]